MKSLKEFKESVKIEDANGNLSAEVFDIIKPEPLKPTYNNICLLYTSDAADE